LGRWAASRCAGTVLVPSRPLRIGDGEDSVEPLDFPFVFGMIVVLVTVVMVTHAPNPIQFKLPPRLKR